ncbi:MAG: cytochrome B6 [Dehalococcoidia bacterium]|nr:cytochrome B6 [Dehalococcoidia bacterium]
MASAAATQRAGAVAAPRRGVLALFGLGTVGLLTLQSLVAFVVFFWPRKRGTFGSVVSMGNVDNYEVDSVTYKIDGKFYLVRLAEGFIALWQKCPHLGCTVPWRENFTFGESTGLFRCPCHNSTYLRNGQIVFGPAPRPMDRMGVQIENGKILVDTGDIQPREKHESEHVTPA